MKFEYDSHKAFLNPQKHGIHFEEAKALWLGNHIIFPALTKGEPRWMIVGMLHGKLCSCIFTVRGQSIRLISCRRSRDEERGIYYEKIS